ncbi:hypothetical protein [Xanthomonas sp.]|nr:hypothetical protein [Xanthomonas sp.]
MGMGRFASHDVAASRAWSRAQLAWQPGPPGLLADLDRAGCFVG